MTCHPNHRPTLRRTLLNGLVVLLALAVLAWPGQPAFAQGSTVATPAPKAKAKPNGATSALPQRDLTVEIRQVEEGNRGGMTLTTEPADAGFKPQVVQVRNGEPSLLRLGRVTPMVWVQAASAQSSAVAASGASASSSGGSINQAMMLLESGQSVWLKPRWPGGNQPVTVEVAVQLASVQASGGSDLPSQLRSQTATTVTTALGEWVTIAATGSRPRPNTYSSEAASEGRQLLQLRVLAL